MAISLSKINFGKAEAEAELTASNHILADVFDDYLGVLNKIEEDDRFLVIGRKGVGKSALAQYYNFEYKEQAHTFTTFINTQALNIEKIINLGETLNDRHNLRITSLLIFQWIILVSLARLLIKNEGIKHLKEFRSLEEFFKVNSGFVSLGESLPVEEILRHKGNVNFEPLQKFMKANFSREFSTERHNIKAPFYTLIPALEEVIKFLLCNEFCSGNKYRVIFDDLDILFKGNNDIPLLAEVLRLIKSYNADSMGAPSADVKILVFIRPDQLQKLSYEVDSSKIINSYGVRISWYDQDLFNYDESKIPLKELISNRLKKSFENESIELKNLEPWDALIDSKGFGGKSSFKYVLDNTMYRPRDLINLLNTLKSKYPNINIPVTKSFLDKAIDEYSSILGEEIQNELIMMFDEKKIEKIIKVLRSFQDEFSYIDFLSKLGLDENECEEMVEILYNYGVLGVRMDNNLMFSHWGLEFEANKNSSFVKHYGLRKFLSKKRISFM